MTNQEKKEKERSCIISAIKKTPEGTVLNRKTKFFLRILDPVELGVPRGSGSLPSRLGSSALLRSFAEPTFSGIGSILVSQNRM